MAIPVGVYPLATDRNTAIPFEVASPLGSFMLTCPGIAERYVTSGDVLMVYSTGFARICVSDALPNMTDEIVSDSFYLPGNTSALIVARGGNIQVAAVNPAAIVSVYFTVVERWLSLAREVKFEDG